jgi:hypothetical protein
MTALTHPPSPQVLPTVWKLLGLRVRISWNSFRHARTRNKIGTIALALVLLLFAGFVFFLSWLLLGFLRSPRLSEYLPFETAPFLQAVPVLILSGLFLGILFTSFGVLLQALYLSGDMDFLLTSPVPIRAVFVTKLLQAVLPNFGLIALFGLPILFGLGVAGGYNFLYYPLVLIVMVVLALAAAGLSSLLVMLIARVFPPRRVAEVLGFFTALISILCSQSGNFFNTMGHDVDISGTQVNGLFATLMRFNTPWMPLNWAGRGLVDLGEGRWLSALLFLGLTLGLATAAFLVALSTAERWYYTGWAGMQVIAQRKKAVRTRRARPERPAALDQSAAAARLRRLIPAPVQAIVRKDFLVMRRDLRNMSQLISPLIFGVLYSLMFLRMGGAPLLGQGEAPDWLMNSFRAVLTYGNVGMSLFVGWMLLGRLAGMGFSSEGKNYWILKASPLRPAQLLAAKYLVAYLPALALGLFFIIGLSILQRTAPGDFLYSLLTVVMCLAGMNGILLGFGTAGANFKWDDPRRMNAGGMGCLGQFIAALFLPLAFGLFIGPLFLVGLADLPQAYGYLGGAVLGTLLCGLGAWLPLWLARKKVERLGEG